MVVKHVSAGAGASQVTLAQLLQRSACASSRELEMGTAPWAHSDHG